MDTAKERVFWTSLARALAGALLFSFPLLMTMEMWWMGFYLSPIKLSLLVILVVPTLVGISHFAGFQALGNWLDHVCNGLSAYGVGFVVAGFFLSVIAIILPGMPLYEIVGKVILLSIPAHRRSDG
jgi:putative integral membrane protein (TIGR02587 family)